MSAPAGVELRPVPVAATRSLRRAVLRPHESLEELAAHEAPGTLAIAAFRSGAIVACGMITPGAGWRVRGMATVAQERGRGIGSAVLGALVDWAFADGAERVWCNARVPAVSLYRRAGWRVISEEFELPAIGPHVVMERLRGLGVLALGDSITNGGGELQWGVAMKSWAEWVARGLGLPYTGCAVDGATVQDVLADQIPAFTARTARPEARYEVGCLYIGVNDVRGSAWDAARFASGHGDALAWLSSRCDRVLAVTVPLDLGRPRAGAEKVAALNAVIRREAGAAGALVVEIEPLRARDLLMSDRVHLTALGQVWLAERALERLTGDGVLVRGRPAEMIKPSRSEWGRLQSDWTYLYRTGKAAARAALLRRLSAPSAPPPP